jgi:mono/diheme cytochrome c family protein
MKKKNSLLFAVLLATSATPHRVLAILPATDASLLKQGAYLARAGDCIACHTAQLGKPFAGGLPLKTPLGTIYSTNITPDNQTGIGTYSYNDFDRALRHGVSKSGYTLYPAMPYPSYARVKPADVRALYEYFMHAVVPVRQANAKSAIPWPLSVRWPLSLWRRAFAPTVAVQNPADADMDVSELMRGRYLVEGLGHCSACHTPRGFALQEKALSDEQGGEFLSGAVVDGWLAKSLRGDVVDGLGSWTRDDIVTFLRSGRNAHSAGFGGMARVVEDSTQYLSDSDLNAIATYLESLKPSKPGSERHGYDGAIAKALHAGDVSMPGARIFVNNCAACHRTDGKGYASVFPQLAGSSTVNTKDPTSLIEIVLVGSAMPSTAAAPMEFTMPGFAARLTDQQLADVVTFIRQSWGNRASVVSEDKVAKARKEVSKAQQ